MYTRYKRSCCNNNMQCVLNTMETSCNYIQQNNDFNTGCGCGFDDNNNVFPSDPMFGQSYVPIQYMNNTFNPCAGLHHGTLFPELVSSYSPGDSMAQINYISNSNTIGKGCNANG